MKRALDTLCAVAVVGGYWLFVLSIIGTFVAAACLVVFPLIGN